MCHTPTTGKHSLYPIGLADDGVCATNLCYNIHLTFTKYRLAMPHILLVEDDPAIAATLRFALEREGWQTTWADTARTARQTLEELPSLDAIVLDVGLPDQDGFGVCQSVRAGEHHAHVPIVFLTARDDEIDTVLALEMGGDDYITKPFSPREVIARIKAIWRREKFVASQQMSEPDEHTPKHTDFVKHIGTHTWQYQHATYTLSLDNCPLCLSKTELAIMLALLDKPTHILSREQILSHASDHPEHRLVRTIDSHIKTLRQKLATVSEDEIILTHRGLGYGLC